MWNKVYFKIYFKYVWISSVGNRMCNKRTRLKCNLRKKKLFHSFKKDKIVCSTGVFVCVHCPGEGLVL